MRGFRSGGLGSCGARLTAVVLAALFFVAGFSLGFNKFAAEGFWRLGGLEQKKDIIVSALPLYGLSGQKEAGGFSFSEIFASRFIFTLSGGGFSSFFPTGALVDSMGAKNDTPVAPPAASPQSGVTGDEPKQPEEEAGGTEEPVTQARLPLVGIYCTHSGETYVPTFGVERVDGRNGGVYEVALQLKESLEALGIGVVLIGTVHDYPEWSLSYQNSLASIEKLKAEYPSIEVFVDIHRDALPVGVSSTANAGGVSAAKMMLVVGSDKRVDFPAWRQNLAFAQEIVKMMEDLYPGLSRGVSIQDGRYNQHVSPMAILVEVGSTTNTLQEAKNSAKILAQILYNLLSD